MAFRRPTVRSRSAPPESPAPCGECRKGLFPYVAACAPKSIGRSLKAPSSDSSSSPLNEWHAHSHRAARLPWLWTDIRHDRVGTHPAENRDDRAVLQGGEIGDSDQSRATLEAGTPRPIPAGQIPPGCIILSPLTGTTESTEVLFQGSVSLMDSGPARCPSDHGRSGRGA